MCAIRASEYVRDPRFAVHGAAIGSSIGKLVAGDKLLFLFALAMIAVGIAMLRPRATEGDPSVSITPAIAEIGRAHV